MSKSAGLTLIEMLIVIALIGLFSVPLYISYTRTQANQGLSATVEELASTAKRAYLYSREAKDQKVWGIKRQDENSFALISGKPDDWSTISITRVEPLVTIPNDFTVLFQIGTGQIDADTSIILVNRYGRQAKVNINKTGNVETETLD